MYVDAHIFPVNYLVNIQCYLEKWLVCLGAVGLCLRGPDYLSIQSLYSSTKVCEKLLL